MLDGIITSDRVASGTPALNTDERREFAAKYQALRKELNSKTNPLWISRV
jgi:hypothetical protein